MPLVWKTLQCGSLSVIDFDEIKHQFAALEFWLAAYAKFPAIFQGDKRVQDVQSRGADQFRDHPVFSLSNFKKRTALTSAELQEQVSGVLQCETRLTAVLNSGASTLLTCSLSNSTRSYCIVINKQDSIIVFSSRKGEVDIPLGLVRNHYKELFGEGDKGPLKIGYLLIDEKRLENAISKAIVLPDVPDFEPITEEDWEVLAKAFGEPTAR